MVTRKRKTKGQKNINQRIDAGCGQGRGVDYQPAIWTRDFSSKGLSTQSLGWKTHRVHHFFSSLEFCYFLTLEWSLIVIDIREQYPLNSEETLLIAQECGVKHPQIPKTKELNVMTLWQIDSTIADIYLVSSLDRKRIIGRPVLYLIVDLFSRLIVGFNISLEGPSWLGAALALENATTNKVKFCAEYDISITAEQWPCHHLCKSLLTDRGSEYLSANATHMVKSLGIELQNTPAFRPDWKAVVERLFRLINDEVIHWEPGAVYKPKERGERDYRLDAIYTLEEFRKIIIRLIIYYNNYHWLSEYPINRAMISDGVDLIPCELWNWGIHNYGRPRFETTEIIRLNLLPTAEASITRRGINFSGLRYTCDLANKEQWFVKAGIKGSWKQKIAYDPRNLDNIYLRLDNGRHLEICSLLPASKTYQNCNWYEVADHFTETNFARHDAKPRQEQAKAALNTYIDDIKTSASEQTVNTFDSQTQNSRVKDIRQNRKAEREYEQELNAWDLRENLCSKPEEQLNSTLTVATSETDDEYVPPHRPIDELRKSLIRKLNNESY